MSLIITKLIGGLGNQMFQYAAGRALAHRYGQELLLDVRGFEHYSLRRYELGEFAVKAGVANAKALVRLGLEPAVSNNMLARVRKYLGFDFRTNILKEASFSYDARIEKVAPTVYLDGYWQSEKYFSGIANQLRQEFELKEPLAAENVEVAVKIADADVHSVSLHIRRGDYVSDPHTAQYHGVCSLDYYRDAVSYIAERISDPHFFIFSDDHAWVQENFKIDYAVTQVNINSPDRGVYDMTLMKACRHHIIANSSFSWWGAWLNPRADKIVIAPQRWFKGVQHDLSDLIPRSWIVL